MKNNKLRSIPWMWMLLVLLGSASVHSQTQSQENVPANLQGSPDVIPVPESTFDGTLEPNSETSTLYLLPEDTKAAEGAPNILLIMTDDVGFAASSTFGGPVETPSLDQLAESGLRYNQFHTVGVCSPTRAALLTGRNHHAVGFGYVPEVTAPYPGYTSRIPDSAATVSRLLRDNGYSTAMFGKEHNVPMDQLTPAGPFDQWPTGRGFEYFYGFIGGDSHQWQPALYENTTPVDNSTRPDNYLLDAELADKTIDWIHNQKAAAPDKPFFVYYAPGTAHAPHQAPAEWIAKYQGKFDQGWDKVREKILTRQKALGVVPQETQLSARPDVIPAWDSLSDVQKRVYARYMEVFAGMVSFQDAQIGRVLDELKRMGIADNTLVIFIEGDNGSSGEGGPEGAFNEIASLVGGHGNFDFDDPQWLLENIEFLGGTKSYQVFPVGWAYATSTPFPWIKHIASHLGGTRNGMVVSWPEKIEQSGGIRSQYHHVIDVVPTLLDAAKVRLPSKVDGVAQKPFDGISMVYSFNGVGTESKRDTQYYEILGNRAIYQDGWLAATTPRNMPWNAAGIRPGSDVTTYPWELYDLRTDFSQADNLAAENPERLKELQSKFDEQARNNNVYPMLDDGSGNRSGVMRKLKGDSSRREYVYWGSNIRVQMPVAPPIFYMGYRLVADIVVPEDGASGVILAAGSNFGGWSFYLKDSVPVVVAAESPFAEGQSRVAAPTPLHPGRHRVQFDFAPKGKGGEMRISVDDNVVIEKDMEKRPLVAAGLGETFDTGRDSNVPVSSDYKNEGIFTGKINKVVVELRP